VTGLGYGAKAQENGPVRFQSMASAITQAEIFIALVVAAHAAVLAVRLSVSLYRN
jgi:photosystem I subunit 12